MKQTDPTQEYAYSNYEDGEDWTPAGCREDCIEEGNHETTGDHFYIGQVHYSKPIDVVKISTDSILDYIIESTDFIPESCIGKWLVDLPTGAEKELKEELEEIVRAWMTRHDLGPDWFSISKIECIERTEVEE